MKQKLTFRFAAICGIILLAAASRMLPHPPNFAPISAMALFGAAYFDRRFLAILVPFVATWLSDLFINNVIYAKYYTEFTWFYEGFIWTYGSYLLIGIFGLLMLRKVTTIRIFGTAIGATAIFFLVSNVGCWVGNPIYPQNLSGLLACYAAGLPFLGATLMGDLVYSGILFGSFEWLKIRVPALQKHI
jgi:hypothetical protein